MSPNAGGGCGVSANKYSCAHGAQINFGDLSPYLTYGELYHTCADRIARKIESSPKSFTPVLHKGRITNLTCISYSMAEKGEGHIKKVNAKANFIPT